MLIRSFDATRIIHRTDDILGTSSHESLTSLRPTVDASTELLEEVRHAVREVQTNLASGFQELLTSDLVHGLLVDCSSENIDDIHLLTVQRHKQVHTHRTHDAGNQEVFLASVRADLLEKGQASQLGIVKNSRSRHFNAIDAALEGNLASNTKRVCLAS